MKESIFNSLPSIKGKTLRYKWRFVLTFWSKTGVSQHYCLTNKKDLNSQDFEYTRLSAAEIQKVDNVKTIMLKNVARFEATNEDQQENSYGMDDAAQEEDIVEFLSKLPEARPYLEAEASKFNFIYFSYQDLWNAEFWAKNSIVKNKHLTLLNTNTDTDKYRY